jgi:hypothetical protein
MTALRQVAFALMVMMGARIILSKLIKLLPHFMRNPGDLLLFPLHVAFAYYMSLVKAYIMLTFWDIAWGSRTNVQDGPAKKRQ